MRTIEEARAKLRELVTAEIVPNVPAGFKRLGSGNQELVRVASALHGERIRISTYRYGEHYLVGMGISVRYPAFEWVRGLAEPIRGKGLGYHVGLRHRPPGEDQHPLEAPDLGEWLLHDVRAHGFPYFEAMSTPEQVLNAVTTQTPKEQLFHLGGPEGRVCAEAALHYAYFDKDKAVDLLEREARDDSYRRPRDIQALRDFLRARPTVPGFGAGARRLRAT